MTSIGVCLTWSLSGDSWTCSRLQEVTRSIDTISLAFVFLNNALTTSALINRSSQTSPILLFVAPLALTLWGVAQHLLSRRFPNLYYRHHGYLQLFNRLIRLPSLILTIRETHRLAAAGNLHATVEKYQASARPGSSAALHLFSATLALSGALQLLMHTTAAPLPLLPQLLLQTAAYLTLLCSQPAPATRLLQHSPLIDTARATCVYLNDALHLSSMMFGVYLRQQPLDAACAAHSYRLLLLFAQLYLGLVLPVFFSYRLQQYILCYLRQHEVRSRPSAAQGLFNAVFFGFQCPPHRLPVLCAADALVLLYLLLMAWVAVVVLHPYADHLAWPAPPAA